MQKKLEKGRKKSAVKDITTYIQVFYKKSTGSVCIYHSTGCSNQESLRQFHASYIRKKDFYVVVYCVTNIRKKVGTRGGERETETGIERNSKIIGKFRKKKIRRNKRKC